MHIRESLALLSVVGLGSAASGQVLEVSPHVVAAGGGTGVGGGLVLSGSVGQAAAGPVAGAMSGGGLAARSGFWPARRELCAADFNGDGAVDTRDVIAFLGAWSAGDADADCDRNGAVDTRDVICFLNLWTGGC